LSLRRGAARIGTPAWRWYPVGAAELLGRARWLRDTYHRPATEAESAAVDAATATARAALDQQVFAAASRAGAAVGLRGAG